MTDGHGLPENIWGVSGLTVLDVQDVSGEVAVTVESPGMEATGLSGSKRAEVQGRVEVHLRDLHRFGRPCRLVVRDRRGGARGGGG